MAKQILEQPGPVTSSDPSGSVLKVVIEQVLGAESLTIKLSIRNTSDKPLPLNKTSTCWRSQLGSDVFAIFPKCDSDVVQERVKYIGPYVNYSNENGQNEFILHPAETMTRQLSLSQFYDFAHWQKRGCSRFWVRYRAVHRLLDRGLVTVESEPVLSEL